MTPVPFFAAPSPAAQKLEALRQLFPQAVEVDDTGRIRVNTAAIQLALDPGNPADLRVEEDGYELRWVGKREAYHQAFVPTAKILSAAHDQSKDWDSTGNLLIKGDNLDALKLLRQSYFGKVKLIYIDPPYNTQSEQFIYRDDFSTNQTEVLSSLGYSADNIDYIKNIYGARTHSGWLSFMYPRLLLAKDLLRDDGVIFISIDDNEQAQLKLLCDEVFGAFSFVGQFPWRKRTAKSDVPFGVSQDYEWVLAYANEKFLAGQSHERVYYQTPDYPNDRWRLSDLTKQTSAEERPNSAFELVNPNDGKRYPFNPKRVWSVTVDTFKNYYDLGKIVFPNDYDFLRIKIPAYRVFESEDKAKAERKHGTQEVLKALSTQLPKEVGMSENGNKDFEDLFEEKFFSFPKPVGLLSYLLGASVDSSELILDFFAGSGTTAEAVMRLNAEDGGNRQFILVQIPQPIDAAKQKEAHHFVTHTLGRPEATIFEITAERIRRAGAKLQAERAAKQQAQGELLTDEAPPLDTGFRVFELVDDPLGLVHGRLLHAATQDHVQELQTLIATPQPADMQRVLSNLLLAEGLPLTTRIHTEVAEHLYVAADVALLLQALPLQALQQTLLALQAAGTPLRYLSVYAPWVQDDNLLLGLETLMDKLGLGKDKLRLRG
jgi:adenine-specific DNA-methyltransferase